ncbi:hypothetical protein NQ314_002499 [Rhamnusium bicolor]|uniref:Lipase domain-containing protein n=1 Tax=Rhamnusium bicolor TaxID=1586634 RepID=A0AAV8ZPB2_9CUCU|nr:hypothetical protein NQ314_002499 [Rhamnusium bicolor]
MDVSGNIFYPLPMRATPDVGKHYAKFLNYLVEDMDVDPKDIHLIGHSLGAHVSGFAGRALKKGKIARITGLDPALPGFDVGLVEGGHLNKNDADFVDIIHTCAGFLGMKQPIGHVDFYPNGGGPPQPGCGILELLEVCSHGRSWRLFAKSIVLDKPFMASECETLQLLWDKACDGKDIPMGEPTPPDARGIYYIKTTDDEPFIIRNWNFIDSNDIAR